jgi:hypothetical protein
VRAPFQRHGWLALCLLLCTAIGCAVDRGRVYIKEGKEYGLTSGLWRERWWNYYERGRSYAEGEFWQEAIADFQTAIRQRAGDQRQARTYGHHYLDYFPHRELGVVYYRLGRYAEAIRHLEISLQYVETARAKFYLNRARQALLQQTGRDREPPLIRVDSPPQGLLTNRFAVQVEGTVEDDTYVSSVIINGQPLFIELAEPRLTFAREIPLQDGANAIDIVAVDLAGRQTSQRLVVQLDRQGPLVGVHRATLIGQHPQRRAYVEGFLSDQSAIARFVLGGRSVPVRPVSEWEFREEVALPPDRETIVFEVEDTAGNVAHGEIALAVDAPRQPGIRKGAAPEPPLPRWAFSADVQSDAADIPPLSVRHAATTEASPVRIDLRGPLKEQTAYYDDRIYLEVTVASRVDRDITAFSINGESLWRRRGRLLFFNYWAPLQLGENRFLLEAFDDAGGSDRKEVVVTRHEDEVKGIDARLRVALLPFDTPDPPSGSTESVYSHLLAAFWRQRRFQLVERERLDALLEEHKIARIELVDPRTRLSLGKILAAEGMLFGVMTEKPQSLEVFIRLVDVETGALLATEDVYGEDLRLREVQDLMEGLAWKVRQRVPLVEGSVIDREGTTIFTDLTRAHRIQPYMRLIVFRDGGVVVDPRTERVRRRPGKRMAEARIAAISADLSEATLLRPDEARDVRQGDKVITK